MSKLLALLLLLGASILLLTATAIADEPASCTFSGSVKLDGAEVADGTLITAAINGVEYHTHTSTGYGYSTYSITISPSEGTSYFDGTKVTFKVTGHPAAETATYKAGANTKLDLNASSAATSYLWLTLLLVILLLIAIGIACYLLFRVIIARRKPPGHAKEISEKKVAAKSAEPITTQKAVEEPVARYVWDSKKLAWVEITEPPRQKLPKDVQIKGKSIEGQPKESRTVARKSDIKSTKVAKFPRRDT